MAYLISISFIIIQNPKSNVDPTPTSTPIYIGMLPFSFRTGDPTVQPDLFVIHKHSELVA